MRRARSVTGSDYVRLGDPEARQATKVGADASMGAGAPTTGWAPDGGTPRMSRSTSRARLAVSAAVTAGLCLTGTAGLVSASQDAPGSCDPAFPVADLIDGQTVSGLTVTHGTGPTGFSGSIIGVLHDRIEPGVDMVMAKLSSTEIQDNGIWAGMSGSPVYAEGTDRLIGAVAYTLSWGETQVAGITPWEDMQAYAGHPAPLQVKIPLSTARSIARTTSVSTEQASQGFTEVATPELVSGLAQRALDRAQDKAQGRNYLTKRVSAAGWTA